MFMDHFVYAANQWETMLHLNVTLHWQGAYINWSLYIESIFIVNKGEIIDVWYP